MEIPQLFGEQYYRGPLTPQISLQCFEYCRRLLTGVSPEILLPRFKYEGCTEKRAAFWIMGMVANWHKLDLIVWRNEILTAALNGASAFRDEPFVRTKINGKSQCWIFDGTVDFLDGETKLLFDIEEGAVLQTVILSHLVGVNELGNGLFADYRNGGFIDSSNLSGRTGLNVTFMYADSRGPIFRVMPTLWDGDAVPPFYCQFIAALAFLDQEFVDLEPMKMPRQWRRSAERKGSPLPDVNVVTLRRSASQHDPDIRNEREYSCQWMVGAHWRKPHARMKEQRPVYVRPYLKGPEDMPFRAPRQTIYAAVR